MDGNNRFSKKKNINLYESYKSGAENLLKLSKYLFEDHRVNTISAFGLSCNNTKRSKVLINSLIKVLEYFLNSFPLQEFNFNIEFRGDLSFFSKKIRDKLININNDIKTSKKKIIIYLNYSGQIDIIRAALKYNDNKINFLKFRKLLSTNNNSDPDILIRTGGYSRISDFFLFEIAFTELFFSKKLWPEFSNRDLNVIISKYMKIERKFGY